MAAKRFNNILDAGQFNIREVKKVYKQVPIELMRPSLFQPRKSFNEAKINELGASLLATGMNFNALIVRPLKFGEGYEIICGERRWRAAQKIGMDTLLCCVADFNDSQALYVCGVDNIQREDLNPIEEATAFDLLIHSGMTHQEVADDIGKSRSHVTHYLRLLKLPLPVRDALAYGKLSYAQARHLCALGAASQQVEVAAKAIKHKWSSTQVARRVSDLQAERKERKVVNADSQDVDIRRLRVMIEEQTGYACVVQRGASGSWQLGFSASTADEFQGILDRLGVSTDAL